MDMLYRDLVEFAVGHGVAVNWRLPAGDKRRAVELYTQMIPAYEVAQVTGAAADDNPDLAGLVLDMKALAEMDATGPMVTARARSLRRCASFAISSSTAQEPATGLSGRRSASTPTCWANRPVSSW